VVFLAAEKRHKKTRDCGAAGGGLGVRFCNHPLTVSRPSGLSLGKASLPEAEPRALDVIEPDSFGLGKGMIAFSKLLSGFDTSK
jgi:hypothetical protein